MSHQLNIRNFSIIAHIDHGKSTLADRMLEVTSTVEKRKMKEQLLDSMELERERGITIKMQPVRMRYALQGEDYILNLIDTPGHIDFSYEVSRSLKAVEGVVLLVDATQGVQAQTLTVLTMATELNLRVIPVINKIDLPTARVSETREEIVKLLGCEPDDILSVSGKTGEGVENLLAEIVKRIPAPQEETQEKGRTKALVFDFEYSNHTGVIVYVRVFSGKISRGDNLQFVALGEKFSALETGVFSPEKIKTDSLGEGEIGYIVTGIKKASEAKVGDTIINPLFVLPPVPGYKNPMPVVWASIYPESQDDFPMLRLALERLHLSDASLAFEEETSGILGRGFRCGFLGMLHLEIITERLKREFNLNLVVTTPTISYEISDEKTKEKEIIYSPILFPEETKGKNITEPWVSINIITPLDYVGDISKILYDHEAVQVSTDLFGDNRVSLKIEMPLRELMRNFFDEIKSISSGFASLSYEILESRPASVVRVDILINEELVPAFTRIVAAKRVQKEAEDMAEKLKSVLPKQLINIKIQAKAMGRILAARSISAMRKDVTDYLYGGDITRKMKLREKQKKGKKKMQRIGKVSIPQDVFIKMMKPE